MPDPENSDRNAPPPASDDPENVWTYRGYRMKTGEFNTAMVHFYRGEITRCNTWRSRLDSTTNWAVATAGAVLTFSFSSANNPPVVILISFLLVSLFLIIESRRYRYYELWALRVRLMETDFFAGMLTPPFSPHHEWANRLTESLLMPRFPISHFEAIGRRLRRNYIWLFLILGLSWSVKLMLHPVPAHSFQNFVDHAQVGFVPGQTVMFIVGTFFCIILLTAILTAGLRNSAGEVLSHYETLAGPGDLLHNLASTASHVFHDEIPFIHRHKQLAIIITNQAELVSYQLISILKRGVTALPGKGMYTGLPRSVLLCAVAPTEMGRLKSLVYAVDENALVIVNATEEILGGSFDPLQPRWRQAAHDKSGK